MSETTGYTGLFVEWIEEWSQFFQRCNWYTFHPIQLEFEDERNMGGVEMTLVILGLGFRLRWNYARTEQVDSLMEQIKEIERRDASLQEKPNE